MKKIIKKTLFLLAAIVMLPFTISYRILDLVLKNDELFAGFSQLLSLIPTKVGNYLRPGFYRFAITHCDEDAVISFLTLFSHKDTEIEQGVYIGPQSNIGSCIIKSNTILGSGVHIMSGKEQHSFDELDTPIKDQGGRFTKISVGSGSWVGNNALIMANIGKNCVVAAGSVVINDVEDYSIVAGNPARVIKNLKG